MVQEGLMRRDDWRGRLADFMDGIRREPFAWGTHDCALGLAVGAVYAITGVEIAPAGVGGYKTPLGALRAMRKAGFSDLGEAVEAYLREVHPAYANIGDIGLIDADDAFGAALCVVDASGLLVLTEAGIGLRPRADMRRAFKIG